MNEKTLCKKSILSDIAEFWHSPLCDRRLPCLIVLTFAKIMRKVVRASYDPKFFQTFPDLTTRHDEIK